MSQVKPNKITTNTRNKKMQCEKKSALAIVKISTKGIGSVKVFAHFVMGGFGSWVTVIKIDSIFLGTFD